MPFEQFPYTNYHDLNLDWILQTVKNGAASIEAVFSEWDNIRTQAQTIIDTQTISVEEAVTSAANARTSEQHAATSQQAAADSAASAHTDAQGIDQKAYAVVTQYAPLLQAYEFFQSISNEISADSDIQQAAAQIATVMTGLLTIDAGTFTDGGASNILDGGTF